MKIRLLATLILIGVSSSPSVRAEIKVTPDKENVVASRLEGDWQLDVPLTKRLDTNEGGAEGGRAVSFKSDPTVAAKIPAKYEKFIGNRQVYLAGIMTFQDPKPREHVFVLIEHKGNPHVVWFRERDGDPLGDAESFNVMLAVAKESRRDLLFIGGDFNNQPFAAYARVKVDK